MARIKRLIDIGLAGLVLVAPVLLFLVAVIYLVDGRPVLVHEDRIDRRGRSITLLAFRTNHGRSHVPNDRMPMPYFGWYLRRSNLDKLPRCWNLLRGDCDLSDLWF